jgi:hypothetical protein
MCVTSDKLSSSPLRGVKQFGGMSAIDLDGMSVFDLHGMSVFDHW